MKVHICVLSDGENCSVTSYVLDDVINRYTTERIIDVADRQSLFVNSQSAAAGYQAALDNSKFRRLE